MVGLIVLNVVQYNGIFQMDKCYARLNNNNYYYYYSNKNTTNNK